MKPLDHHTLDRAFVHPETPMFAELLRRLEEDVDLARPPEEQQCVAVGDEAFRSEVTDLMPSRRRDLRSGLSRVAKALGRSPENVPADPQWLQPRLERIVPAALGLTAKSWSNALSDARAALAHFGVTQHRRHRSDLSPDWQHMWSIVLAARDKSLEPALRCFVHFLSQHDITPDEVSDTHAEAYREALVLNEISRSPDVAWRAAVNNWNLAVRRLPEWPQHILVLPSRQKRVQLPPDSLPKGFHGDLEQYLHRLGHPDPLVSDGRLKPLRATTLKQYRLELLRFASVLVHSGVPIERIDGLGALVELDQMTAGLRWMLDQNAGKTTQSISRTMELLKDIARNHVRVPEDRQTEIERLAKRLKIKWQTGMTPKNRDRLRPLQDPATLRRLLLLPERLFEKGRGLGNIYKAALLQECAVAIAILLYCPLRRRNLASVHLDRNLQRPGDGRVFLVFEPDQVKNERRIEFELPGVVVSLIDRHLATRSPRLCPPGTPWLFPKRDGSCPMDLNLLAENVCRTIRRETGIEFNMHLFRHLAAMLWLDAQPGAYEVVRRLLGHSEVSRTISAYAGFEAGTATRLFAGVIEKARKT